MNVFETKELKFAYPGGNPVLKGISINVNQGDFVALVGVNGCGKTTLLQIFNGLLKPDNGKIYLFEQEIGQWKPLEVFRRVGMVFQDPNDQLFAATVYEDVTYGPQNLGLDPIEVKKRGESALKAMGIWELREQNLHQLSFGQKKRAAIAGVLAMQPDVVILDEPTAGLDPRTASALMKLLKSLQREKGITIIISTHDVDMIPVYCGQVFVMNEGTIVKSGSPYEVFANPDDMRENGLRLPRIGHLFEIIAGRKKINLHHYPLTISDGLKTLKDWNF